MTNPKMRNPADVANEIYEEAKIKQEQHLNNVTMLQLITSKIEKVFAGKHYNLNLIISALCIMIAKAIAAGPRELHGKMLMQVAKTIHDSVVATYPEPIKITGSDGSSAEKPTDANGVVSAEAPKSIN